MYLSMYQRYIVRVGLHVVSSSPLMQIKGTVVKANCSCKEIQCITGRCFDHCEKLMVFTEILASEYSRLLFASATTCETRRKTSAIHRQKFHTDDVNLSWIWTGALSVKIYLVQCPSLKIFRLCVQSIRPMFNISSLKESQAPRLFIVLSVLRRFSSICWPNQLFVRGIFVTLAILIMPF